MVQYLPGSGSNYSFVETPSLQERDLPNNMQVLSYEFHLYKEDVFGSGYPLETMHDTVRRGRSFRLQSLQINAP